MALPGRQAPADGLRVAWGGGRTARAAPAVMHPPPVLFLRGVTCWDGLFVAGKPVQLAGLSGLGLSGTSGPPLWPPDRVWGTFQLLLRHPAPPSLQNRHCQYRRHVSAPIKQPSQSKWIVAPLLLTSDSHFPASGAGESLPAPYFQLPSVLAAPIPSAPTLCGMVTLLHPDTRNFMVLPSQKWCVLTGLAQERCFELRSTKTGPALMASVAKPGTLRLSARPYPSCTLLRCKESPG